MKNGPVIATRDLPYKRFTWLYVVVVVARQVNGIALHGEHQALVRKLSRSTRVATRQLATGPARKPAARARLCAHGWGAHLGGVPGRHVLFQPSQTRNRLRQLAVPLQGRCLVLHLQTLGHRHFTNAGSQVPGCCAT